MFDRESILNPLRPPLDFSGGAYDAAEAAPEPEPRFFMHGLFEEIPGCDTAPLSMRQALQDDQALRQAFASHRRPR
jgi:hypothetical protein